MNIDRREPRPEERDHTQAQYAWNELPRPLTLGFADEAGAVFADEASGALWYFDVNNMTYRPLAESDVPQHRHELHTPYDLAQGTVYDNGALAAMHVRRAHLQEQLQVLAALHKSDAHKAAAAVMTDALTEELGYVNAYITDSDPKERALLTGELHAMYADMRADDDTSAEHPIAAK